MTFLPRPNSAVRVLAGATLLMAAAGVVAIWQALRVPLGPGAFVLLLVALGALLLATLGLAYTLSFRTLTYYLDRNGLVVDAGLWKFTIPMEAIQGIYANPEDSWGRLFRGLRFGGHNVGVSRTPAGTSVVFAASAPPEECLYVKTGTRVYAVSPANRDGFLRAYQAERELGPLHALSEGLQMPVWLRALEWRDRLGLSLTVGTLAAGLVLLAMCFWRYPNLPPEVPMHFDALGRPDRMASPSNIFYLPLVGGTVVLVNYALAIPLYRHERLLSYFLWAGAGAVQVILILALQAITS